MDPLTICREMVTIKHAYLRQHYSSFSEQPYRQRLVGLGFSKEYAEELIGRWWWTLPTPGYPARKEDL